MSDYHCLDIEFQNVDFSAYSIKGKTEVSKVHHAHLTSKDNEIELKILFDDLSYFGDKFMYWTSEIDFKKFGTFLKVEVTKNHTNERLQKVDLSNAKLIGCTNSSNYYENGKKYIIVKIDTAKFYWSPVEHEVQTAEFYLDDKGFRVVEPFYSFLSPKSWAKNDGKFDIGRKYKAFAKAVAPRKTVIFALQMSNKHSIIVSNISVESVSNRTSFSSKTLGVMLLDT